MGPTKFAVGVVYVTNDTKSYLLYLQVYNTKKLVFEINHHGRIWCAYFYDQYHGSWCVGDAGNQTIIQTGLVCHGYSGFSNKSVKHPLMPGHLGLFLLPLINSNPARLCEYTKYTVRNAITLTLANFNCAVVSVSGRVPMQFPNQ